MSEGKIWNRMTAWMRTSQSATQDGGADEGGEPTNIAVTTKRSDATLSRLEEGYNKVIDLVDAIKSHQQEQDARAVEISSSLGKLANTLEQINSTSQQQSDSLAVIAEQVRTGNQRAAKWEEAISEFPKMAEAQRVALASVVEQLEAAGARDGALSGSIDGFRDAVATLSDASTASSVAVKDLQLSTLETQERTAELIREQSKRFTMLFVVTVVLALMAMIAGVATLWPKG